MCATVQTVVFVCYNTDCRVLFVCYSTDFIVILVCYNTDYNFLCTTIQTAGLLCELQ